MHIQAKDFTIFVKSILSDYFKNKKVLDVGSGDINGNNQFLFENCEYNGNDVVQAPNVTIVSKTKDLPFEDHTFDTIISTECFEHDPEYVASLLKIYAMLKPNGLLCFTCASIGRPEHGTKRTSPRDSYGTIGNLEDMNDYYKNLTEQDINNVLPFNTLFSRWDTYYHPISKDLYFVGIKTDNMIYEPLPKYVTNNIEYTSARIGHIVSDTIHTIFNRYNTDKNSSFHNYSRQYQQLFDPFREKPIKYLEIGVFNGGSVRAMREVFKNASVIVGIDINPKCKQYEDQSNHIFIEIGNATTPEMIENITQKYGTFDIILDDGSHTNRDVIISFEHLFPLLNDNGLYIVEDTICYKLKSHILPNYDNHLTYFFKYTQYLNQCRYDSTDGVKDYCIDPYKILKKTDNVFEYSIDKIEYGCSYIAIYKKFRNHWIK